MTLGKGPRRLLRALRRRARRWFPPRPDSRSTIEQWRDRAREHGARAVFNLGHGPEEMARVTDLQRRELFPLLRARLRGDERLVLDFGCGPGRFTLDLAEVTGAQVMGVDPIQGLLDLAPRHPSADYRLMAEGQIPLETGTVDVAWICLVLGGIHGPALERTIEDLRRVMRPGGLVFLVENTNEAAGDSFWAFRSVTDYQKMFLPVMLEHLHDYTDLGERISVMSGRTVVLVLDP
jgi:SAM-dependent methyltransferase